MRSKREENTSLFFKKYEKESCKKAINYFESDQLKAQNRDDNGNLNVPFWRATAIASDTRVRPKTTVTLEYVFALDDPDDEPTAEARLVYRPVIRHLAESKRWITKDILITSSAW